jgi:PAS domain S-box-containing protein
MEREGGALAHIDLGVLGKTMLDAALAARIGVTLTLVGPPARNVYVSAAAAELLGWTVEELIERDPLVVVAPEEYPRVRARLERRARGEKGETTYEFVRIGKDGRRLPIEVTASSVAIDGEAAVFTFLVDASARKAAEAERLRNEARFRALIESAPEPIGIVRDGRYRYANRACIDAFGFSDPESLYATPVNAMLDAEEAAIRDAREELILSGGAAQSALTYRFRRRDGSIAFLEVSAVLVEYEGKPSVLTMARDITARRNLEMQLVQADRLAALGTMAAGVAHEINNPLAYVLLNLEWIARKLPDTGGEPILIARLVDILTEARHGAQRVSAIVRELRSFSRADGETRRRVDLGAVVQSAIKIAGHEIRHRARLTTTIERVGPVWANEARLEQVVVNLLMNAAQAVPENRAETNEVRVVVREADGCRAVLEVSDNGEGIPAEVLPRIFDPFFTTKPVGVGTGLGLSICHGIVVSLQGQISALSTPGDGATFRVVLPTTEPAPELATPGAEAAAAAGDTRARVLVVDDEPAIAKTLRELLGRTHEVVGATSGRDAITTLQLDPDFDVVLCDLMMPGTSGIEVYEEIRSERPALAARIVFMTGGAFTPRAAEFLAKVENRRIEKPFSLGLVERIVREMASARPARRSRVARVLLNVDLGELPGEPDELYAWAHVANIACGGHAGDRGSMQRAVALCLTRGAAVGAHPSYPDREGFGRRECAMPGSALRAAVAEQCDRLAAIAREAGAPIPFVKPHGALYHAAARDPELAAAVVHGARDALGPGVRIIGPARGNLLTAASAAALGYAREAFADRALALDGSLVPRTEPGALIVDPFAATEQARRLVARGDVDTICVHGDTPGAPVIARAVREMLDEMAEARP